MVIKERLTNTLEIAEEAYKQEQKRLISLNLKADNLTKYVSIFLVILNIVVPMIVKYTNVNFMIAISAYTLVCIPSILSLVFAVNVQKISKIHRFPNGHKLLDMTRETVDTEVEWLKFKIVQYDKAISVLEENNDAKAEEIRNGYNCYIFSVVMLTVFTFAIIIRGYLI